MRVREFLGKPVLGSQGHRMGRNGNPEKEMDTWILGHDWQQPIFCLFLVEGTLMQDGFAILIHLL